MVRRRRIIFHRAGNQMCLLNPRITLIQRTRISAKGKKSTIYTTQSMLITPRETSPILEVVVKSLKSLQWENTMNITTTSLVITTWAKLLCPILQGYRLSIVQQENLTINRLPQFLINLSLDRILQLSSHTKRKKLSMIVQNTTMITSTRTPKLLRELGLIEITYSLLILLISTQETILELWCTSTQIIELPTKSITLISITTLLIW